MVPVQVQVKLEHVLGAVEDGVGAVFENDFGGEIGVLGHKHPAHRALVPRRGFDKPGRVRRGIGGNPEKQHHDMGKRLHAIFIPLGNR